MRTNGWVTSLAGVAGLWLCLAIGTAAQEQTSERPVEGGQSGEAGAAAGAVAPGGDQLVSRVPRDRFADLTFSNRYIVTFRAIVVLNEPADRAGTAARVLSRLVDERITGPVASRTLRRASVITVGGRDVFGIVPEDLDPGSDDLDAVTAETMARLRIALAEAVEARVPRLLAWGLARALTATALLAVVIVAILRVRRLVSRVVLGAAFTRLRRSRLSRDSGVLNASRFQEVAHAGLRVAAAALAAVAVYTWLTYVLQQFPLTRPWGETLGTFLGSTLTRLGLGALGSLPGLFTAAIIFLVARYCVRLCIAFLTAVERGRIVLAGIDPPKAAPTRRLLTVFIWIFAAVVAYPYLPGSNTEAFKGASVMVGLMLSLGSSGIVNHVMSGFMLTYSGAIAPGDYARIGDVEGTVSSLGVLSTKVRTRRNEEVTIPNAVVVSGTTVNYTRLAREGVYLSTAVTIGYDTPWRQVEALLLGAAARLPGLRPDRPAQVLQTDLSDFYAEYTLLVCPVDPSGRITLLAALRAHIQDHFNEHGVQIMSPHYERDPAQAKVVPKEHWFDAPAAPPQPGSTGGPFAA